MKKEVVRKLRESIVQKGNDEAILKVIGICWDCRKVWIETVNSVRLFRELISNGVFCGDCKKSINKIAVIRKLMLAHDVDKEIKGVVSEANKSGMYESVGYSFYKLYQEQ